MKAITSNVSKSLPIGARLQCVDNTGAREVEIVSVKGYKGVRRRLASAGVGDMVVISVKKGTVEMRRESHHCRGGQAEKGIPQGRRLKGKI